MSEEKEYIIDPICNTEEMKKMFVGGIALNTTDEELKNFFEQVSGGTVADQMIIRKDTDKKTHFGFVTFEKCEQLDDVLLKRSELLFKERQLDVNRAVPKNNNTPGAHERTKKLFIANLPKFDCTEEQVRKYLEDRHPPKYGTIESVQLIKKKGENGERLEENKGYGFVIVSSEDLADKMAIQHASFEFGGRKIEMKKSVPRADNQKHGGGGGGGYGGYPGGYGGWGGYGDQWGGYGGGYDAYGGYGGAYAYGGGYGGAQPMSKPARYAPY